MIVRIEDARTRRTEKLVFETARILAPDSTAVLQWYHGQGIEALGNMTAAHLVAQGQGALVLDYLRRVVTLERRRSD